MIFIFDFNNEHMNEQISKLRAIMRRTEGRINASCRFPEKTVQLKRNQAAEDKKRQTIFGRLK